MAILENRLVAEASTAAWQDYLMFNAFIALLCLFPALPFWRRTKYEVSATPEPVAVAAPGTATSNGAQTSQARSTTRSTM
jgi:hypothetical protein